MQRDAGWKNSTAVLPSVQAVTASSIPSLPSKCFTSGRSRDPKRSRLEKYDSRNLTNVYEMYVLTTGITKLYEKLVVSLSAAEREKVAAVPQCLGRAFLQRLLQGSISLKSCPGSDLSAAQRDLRYLSLEQLLTIRQGTLTFSTESETHSAHHNFLRTVEFHMFERLSQRYIRGAIGESATSSQHYALGLDMALMLGAADLLSNTETAPEDTTVKPSLPSPLWGFKLDGNDWPGKVAIYNCSELWIEVFDDSTSDFSQLAAGNMVCVCSNRTNGVGRTRMFDCDVLFMDPRKEDLVSEMNRVEKKVQSLLAKEMEEALRKRKAVARDQSPHSDRDRSGSTLSTDTASSQSPGVMKGNVTVADRVSQLDKHSPEKGLPPRWKLERLAKQRTASMDAQEEKIENNETARRGFDEAFLQACRTPEAQDSADREFTHEYSTDIATLLDSDEPLPDWEVWLAEQRMGEDKADRNGCGLGFCCPVVRSTPRDVKDDPRSNGEEGGLFAWFGYVYCCVSRQNMPP